MPGSSQTRSAYHPDSLIEAVVNAVGDGIAFINTDLVIEYQNRAVFETYGDNIGRRCYKAFRGRETPCDDCIVLAVIKDGKPRRSVKDITLPNGKVLLVEINSAPFRNEAGQIVGAVEAVRDVTEQKKAEALLNQTLLEKNETLRNLNAELSDAAGYVKTVLPDPMVCGNIRTDWRFIPSAALGGDSFGYHWLDDHHFAVYLIDVSGHGWGAALFSVSIINVIRSHALPQTDFKDPAQVLTALNRAFPSEKHNDMFFSLWYGVFNASTRTLRYASGGHPPAILFTDSLSDIRRFRRLTTGNCIIGGLPSAQFNNESLKIPLPSYLYIFSDGIFEVTTHGGAVWGLGNFMAFVADSLDKGRCGLTQILDHVKALTSSEAFEDDVTLLEIRFA